MWCLGRNPQGWFFQGDQLLRQNNQTKYYREFLGIVAGEEVEPSSLGEAVQTLCEQTSIFWVRRGEGELDKTRCRRGKHSWFWFADRSRLCCSEADTWPCEPQCWRGKAASPPPWHQHPTEQTLVLYSCHLPPLQSSLLSSPFVFTLALIRKAIP